MNRALTIGNIVFALFLAAVAAGVMIWFSTERKEKKPPVLTFENGINSVAPGTTRSAPWVAGADDPSAVPILVSDGERTITLMSKPDLLLGNIAPEGALLGNDTFTKLLAKKYDGSVIPGGPHGEWVGAAATIDESEADDTVSGDDGNSWFGGVASLLSGASGKLRATIATVDGMAATDAGEHYYIRVGDSATMLVIDQKTIGGSVFEKDIRTMMEGIKEK